MKGGARGDPSTAARGFALAPRHVDLALARQDAAIRRAGGDGLTEEQRTAIEHVCGPERIGVVVGKAGAGKSTALRAAREAWEAQGYRVHGAALSGKAAEGLEESAGIASRTLASWSRGWERGFDHLGSRDVFVIDEAGMVGSKQLAGFITEAERAEAKVVLVGDAEQLQPIGAGAAFRAVAERVGFVELEMIRRQHELWQRSASVDFGRHRTAEGLAAYAAHGGVRFAADSDAAQRAIVGDVLSDMVARPEGSRLVLAHRRADVQALNEAIRGARQAEGMLGRGVAAGEIVYRTSEGDRAFAPGDRVLFRENDRGLGVKNGMLGTVTATSDARLEIRLDAAAGPGRGRAVSVSMADHAAVDHGYATTIHKSQGATVDRAYVLASGTMDRHLAYVAMTRHREGAVLYADREEFADLGVLTARLSRSNAKETTLDYDRAAYAGRRGIEVGQREVVPAREIATGRAGFRERFEAHQQQRAAEVARDRQAYGLVREWTRLSAGYSKVLPGLEADPALVGGARAELLGFAQMLDRHADAAQRLRARGRDFGVKEGSSLARVLAAPDAGRAIGRLIEGAERDMRGRLALEAERAAARRQQEKSLSRGRGMSR